VTGGASPAEGMRNLSAPGLRTFVNPYSYRVLRAARPEYLSGDRFEVNYDGVSLALVASWLGRARVVRRSFDDTSLAPVVFSECAEAGLRVALVGSAPGVAASAAEFLRARYSGLIIDFAQDGYYSELGEQEVLSRAARCEVVICSMGTPIQEDFLIKLSSRGWNGAGYTCGGYLDQLVDAGGAGYYPPVFDRLNIRWLYRLLMEPARLVPRYFFDYPVGLAQFIVDNVFFGKRVKR